MNGASLAQLQEKFTVIFDWALEQLKSQSQKIRMEANLLMGNLALYHCNFIIEQPSRLENLYANFKACMENSQEHPLIVLNSLITIRNIIVKLAEVGQQGILSGCVQEIVTLGCQKATDPNYLDRGLSTMDQVSDIIQYSDPLQLREIYQQLAMNVLEQINLYLNNDGSFTEDQRNKVIVNFGGSLQVLLVRLENDYIS